MFAQSYLNTAVQVLKEYRGEEPLASFLKKFFSVHKKYGSRDRKHISHICYCYFRLGKSLIQIPVEERIAAGLYLCNQDSHPVITLVKPEWNRYISEELEVRIEVLQKEFGFIVLEIFPFQTYLSSEIDHYTFALSFLNQPDIYLRIRPGRHTSLKSKLYRAEVAFREISQSCIAVSPATKLENHLDINKDVVIQDVNSQKVLQSLVEIMKDTNKRFSAWDCCAASGGKSILLKDIFPNSLLTVSDIRESILINLRKRFKEAGISDFSWFVADISNSSFSHNKQYDLIICDAPCSGSGTWGRTPEQLYFFSEDKIDYYASLQQKISLNASKYVKKGGHFLYITCSVFKEENESIVELLQQNTTLQLQSMQYFSGYNEKADTLFTALFTKQ